MTSPTRSISPEGLAPTALPLPRACPPQAAQLHRLAALITEDDLPPASVTISEDRLSVHPLLSDSDQDAEVTVRRWAQALDLTVADLPHTADDGTADRFLLATGARLGFGYVTVAAILALEVAA